MSHLPTKFCQNLLMLFLVIHLTEVDWLKSLIYFFALIQHRYQKNLYCWSLVLHIRWVLDTGWIQGNFHLRKLWASVQSFTVVAINFNFVPVCHGWGLRKRRFMPPCGIYATLWDLYNFMPLCFYITLIMHEFMFRREVGLSLWSTLTLRINTKIIGNMNWS